MGLDMYLQAERFVSGYDFFPADKPVFEAVVAAVEAEDLIDPETPMAHVNVTIGYWRKANAIHAWFVNELAGGVDECQKIYVPKERLVELRELVTTVLKDPSRAEELLPPQSGFFFGSTEVDDWYMQDLATTLGIVNKALDLDEGRWTLHYQASW